MVHKLLTTMNRKERSDTKLGINVVSNFSASVHLSVRAASFFYLSESFNIQQKLIYVTFFFCLKTHYIPQNLQKKHTWFEIFTKKRLAVLTKKKGFEIDLCFLIFIQQSKFLSIQNIQSLCFWYEQKFNTIKTFV